jgi:Outer membrane protein beta-barrel domain
MSTLRLALPVARLYSSVTDGGTSMTSRKSGFAILSALTLAVLCVNAPAVQAQSVPYWTTTTGFGSALTSDPNASAYGNLSSRYNFENGWFIGTERGNLGFGPTSFSPVGAWGVSSFSYEGSQVGYNFKIAPVSIYAGLDTLKYNGPTIGSPFNGLDSSSSNVPGGYRLNAGVEFRPTSNLSLSFGASFAQQPSDMNTALLPGASPLAFGRRY